MFFSKIFFSFENSPPGDLVLGLGVLLEEGVGEAALEVTQEPFRFQNQPSLIRENGIIIKQESESDLLIVPIPERTNSDNANGIIIAKETGR